MSGQSRVARSSVLGSVIVGDDAPVRVMGALNVSPESFYGGSVHVHGDDLVRAAEAMVDAGADLIDVGAMSTAPYLATTVTEEQERRRLGDAVAHLTRKLSVPISADTARPGPLLAAIDAGATVLNDVTGLADDRVGRLVADHALSVVLMASPAATIAPVDDSDPVACVRGCLERAQARATEAGIPAERLVLDPGIGFFLDEPEARARWDVRVLASLRAFGALGRPLGVGVSRKSFIGTLTGRVAPAVRLAGSLAATTVAVLGGAALIRTHDVAETIDAVRVAERLRDAQAA
jgi:dihydropteroate synthase